MGWYRQQVLPHLVDRSLRGPRWDSRRRRAAAGLSGTVVEIGFGSGLNVAHYPDAVRLVYAVEPSSLARRLAEPRVAACRAEVRHVGIDAARLPLADDSCDGALSTFTLCTVPDLTAALAELRRVLRPGGRVHFLEHGLAPQPGMARLQHLVEPVQKQLADGCHLTRDPAASMQGAGFGIVELESGYAGVRGPWTYLSSGVAASTAA